MLRNYLWFGARCLIPSWLEASEVLKTSYSIGGVQAGITFLSVFAYVHGKVSRDWIQRHDLLKYLGLI